MVLSVVHSAALVLVYGPLWSTVVLGCNVVWQFELNDKDGASVVEQPVYSSIALQLKCMTCMESC